ncbi:MAG: hypothetical protein QNJ89_03730 [Acidimicrobiia bacterium]|nr:hypothetical protein [Acidimicrobiia bacterium]
MHHRHTVLLLVIALLTVAACSGNSEADGIATLESTVPEVETTAPPADPSADSEQAALDFAQCMRENGIDMGDPTVDSDGNLQLAPIEFTVSPDADPEAAKAEMDAVFAECEQHLDGIALKSVNPSSAVEFEDALLEYAGCMREQGIDMPDPDLRGGTIELGGDSKGDIAEFEAAHEECKEILARVGKDF